MPEQKPGHVEFWEWFTGQKALQYQEEEYCTLGGRGKRHKVSDVFCWIKKGCWYYWGVYGSPCNVPDIEKFLAFESETAIENRIERWCRQQDTPQLYGCFWVGFTINPSKDDERGYASFASIRNRRYEWLPDVPVQTDDCEYIEAFEPTKRAALVAVVVGIMKRKDGS